MSSLNVKDRIGAVLIKRQMITQTKLDEVAKLQKSQKEKFGDLLIRLGYVTQEGYMEILSQEMGIAFIRLARFKPDPDIVKLISKKLAESNVLIPISKTKNVLTVAISDPFNIKAIDEVRLSTKFEVRIVIASEKDIKDTLNLIYAENVKEELDDVVKGLQDGDELEVNAVVDDAGDASKQQLMVLTEDEPVVKLTNSILSECVKRRSSDIFVEPEEKAMRVRARVDGMLQEVIMTSKGMHAGVVSRMKVMSGLDIAEHRIPQDGRFKTKINGKEVDFRVNVLPTYFGEKVCLRILDKSAALLDIEKSGFEPEPLEQLKSAVTHPHGMIVVCGPTGSGKTTTLYSLLRLVDSPEHNIVTVEDPVEFQIDGLNQVPIRADVNMTFAAALRSILRQDPDIIMVGEIRDGETADVAIKAALTGHLVLSTLHATTAPGAITRFANMGVEPFLITSSLLLAGSQRLVRKICEKCKEPYTPSPETVKLLELNDEIIERAGQNPKKLTFWKGKGCPSCSNKGYSGRCVLLEAITMTNSIKALVLKRAQEFEIKELARQEGMRTLRENGIAKLLKGITTPEEVIRVTVSDSIMVAE